MKQARIKPFFQQVAETARRREQLRAYRRNQVLGLAAGGGGDPALVSPAHQSQVDLSAGMVAAMSPSRTTASSSPLEENQAPLAVLLLGPTGSGKTALSLALGERFAGEIVSCDSVAVYRGMELGTAKPTIEERARLPHHLIDVADPDQPFTAGEYSRRARAALAGDRQPQPSAHRHRRDGPLPARAHRGALCRAGAAAGVARTSATQPPEARRMPGCTACSSGSTRPRPSASTRTTRPS